MADLHMAKAGEKTDKGGGEELAATWGDGTHNAKSVFNLQSSLEKIN